MNVSNHNASRPSHAIKITIPPSDALQSRQVKEKPPGRVQPSRINRGNRMADIMANIEEDDESRTAVPRRKKRQVVESDPEDVPEKVNCNPMAPLTKKRRQFDVEKPACNIPLPLQPNLPAQVPPGFRQNPRPRPVPRTQFHTQLPQSTSESQPQPQLRRQPQGSRPQSLPAATSNLSNGEPMQEDHDNRGLHS